MLNLTDIQKCNVSITPVDAKGIQVPVDGVPAWASSNDAVATVAPSADGLSADIVAGVPGTVTISVTADAQIGDGVTPIAGTLDVTVGPSAAISVEIVAGTPEAQG